jgi:polyphosphate:AMP phosphotransferase
MFETAEVGSEIDKPTYDKQLPELRSRLLEAQRQLASSGFSVVVLVSGVEGAGKSEVVNTLLEWMDARGIRTVAFGGDPNSEEAAYPEYWRYWQKLPAKGHMGIFFGSWYSAPIVLRAFDRESQSRFDQRLEQAVEFERMLTSEDVVLVKLWMHIAKKVQKKRLRRLEKDPLQRWRVHKRDWKFFARYDQFREASEHALRRTSTGKAPWHIVESTDERYRNVTVGNLLLKAIEDRLAAEKAQSGKSAKPPAQPKPPPNNVLRKLDLTLGMKKGVAERRVLKHQGQIATLVRKLGKKRRSLVLVFEGQDAAGKGGNIRRVTAAIDARFYQINAVAAPTDEERNHPYLWRFWRNVPRLGHVGIFDRSWYGRVLVERVEGFAKPSEWQRAFAEINNFEDQLIANGAILRKFWIQIGQHEQLERFKSRQNTPYKQYKITPEDWRNRGKWDAYEAAAVEMFEKTSTEDAPWVLVEGNDKEYARVKVLKAVADALEDAIG